MCEVPTAPPTPHFKPTINSVCLSSPISLCGLCFWSHYRALLCHTASTLASVCQPSSHNVDTYHTCPCLATRVSLFGHLLRLAWFAQLVKLTVSLFGRACFVLALCATRCALLACYHHLPSLSSSLSHMPDGGCLTCRTLARLLS